MKYTPRSITEEGMKGLALLAFAGSTMFPQGCMLHYAPDKQSGDYCGTVITTSGSQGPTLEEIYKFVDLSGMTFEEITDFEKKHPRLASDYDGDGLIDSIPRNAIKIKKAPYRNQLD